jgi:DNA repair exonuclease SbcCD ATPase subunit
MNLQTLRSSLDKRKGQKQQLEKTLKEAKESLVINSRNLRRHEQARELIREAGLKTQQTLSYHISEITSLALEAIFENPYTLEVNFIQRRNKTECDLFFSRDGNQIDPMDASGGGAVDVAAFALRTASWSMKRPHYRNTIILDEPFKNLSKDYQEKGSTMLKEVSKRLGIQFIVVTHEECLASFADRTFEVKIGRKGISRVTIIEKDETGYSS